MANGLDRATSRTTTAIAAALRRGRASLGMTQQDLADALDVSRPYVVSIESGRAAHQLSRLIRALHLVGLELVVLPRDHPLAQLQSTTEPQAPKRVDRR